MSDNELALLSILRRRLRPPACSGNDFSLIKTGRSYPELLPCRERSVSEIENGELKLCAILNTCPANSKNKNGILICDIIAALDERAANNSVFRKEICDGTNFIYYLIERGLIDDIVKYYLIDFYILQKTKVNLRDRDIARINNEPWKLIK